MFADATDRYVAVCADLVEFQPEGRLTRAETEELMAGFEQLKADAAHSAPHVVLDEMEQITDEARDVGERYQRTAESMLARIDAHASDLGLIRCRMTIFASEMLRRLADDIDAHLIELVRALHRRDDECFQELKADISNLLDDFLEEAAKETGRSRYRQLERSPRFAESGGLRQARRRQTRDRSTCSNVSVRASRRRHPHEPARPCSASWTTMT